MEISRQSGIAIRGRSAAKRAGELADLQFGTIARRQLLEVGFTRARIDRWIKSDRLHRKYPGVYALGRAGIGTEGELAAAILYAGHGSALGGVSALWWLGLLSRRPYPARIDTICRRAPQTGLCLRRVEVAYRSLHRGLPVTSLPHALLASTPDLGHNSLRLVLARAEFQRILDLPALENAIGRGRAGTTALRAALDAHLPQLARCVNGLERDFVLLCERHRLPLPEPNPRIGRYRPDMLWRSQRLIVELDGAGAHSTPAQLAADARRRAALEALGYTVLRFTPAELELEPERVAATVRRHLA
jgi:hypothetical protein